MQKKGEIDFNMINPIIKKEGRTFIKIRFTNSKKIFNFDFFREDIRDQWFEEVEKVENRIFKKGFFFDILSNKITE